MKILSSALFLASLSVSTHAFTNSRTSSRTAPHFASVIEETPASEANLNVQESQVDVTEKKSPVTKKTTEKRKAGGHSQDGPLAPFVVMTKKVMGDAELNKLRGKVISMHSQVIGSFVETAETEFGDQVLRKLFELADTDQNGTVEEEELAVALQALGFSHLKDKQLSGIFQRADADSNGTIDYEEWKKMAPSTLRTNLIKLAKKNGAELGFLA